MRAPFPPTGSVLLLIDLQNAIAPELVRT